MPATGADVISWIVEPRALSFGLFNRQTWTVTKLPAQAGYSVHTSSLAFLADGRLFWHKPRVSFEVWTLDESQVGTLTRCTIWPLPLALRDYDMQSTVLAEGKVGLSVEGLAHIDQSAAGLYWVDLAQGRLSKVNDLPARPPYSDATFARAIQGSPDGLGALYLREALPSGQLALMYVPADGSSLIEFGTTLGQAVEQVTWLMAAAH